MVIRLTAELEAVLTDHAARRGVSAEHIALDALRHQFLGNAASLEPQDDWERGLFNAALDCGVSVPDWALSSEGLYE
jgi:hypothetical protein